MTVGCAVTVGLKVVVGCTVVVGAELGATDGSSDVEGTTLMSTG